jgi:hypothetical protein
MLFTKVAEKTPNLAKRNVSTHFVLITTRNSSYMTRVDNVLVVATTFAMFVFK